MEASVEPQPRGPDWMPITPKTGSLFHADSQRIARFFASLRAKAEQLDAVQRWYRILSEALRKYLRGRQLVPPARLQPA